MRFSCCSGFAMDLFDNIKLLCTIIRTLLVGLNCKDSKGVLLVSKLFSKRKPYMY